MKRRRVYAASFLTVAVGVGVFAVWYMGPAKDAKGRNDQSVLGATTENVQVIGNGYLSTEIPGRFTLKTQKVSDTIPVFIQQLYTVPIKTVDTIFGEQFALTVGDMQGSPLKEVPAVQLRLGDTNYTRLFDGFDANTYVFTSIQHGYEIGAFLAHGKNYAALVLTAQPTHEQQAMSEMKAMLQALTWQ